MSRVAELQGRRDTEAEDTPEEVGTDDDDDGDDDDEEEEEEEGGSGRLVNEEGDVCACCLRSIYFLLLHVCRVEDGHLEGGSGRLANEKGDLIGCVLVASAEIFILLHVFRV